MKSSGGNTRNGGERAHQPGLRRVRSGLLSRQRIRRLLQPGQRRLAVRPRPPEPGLASWRHGSKPCQTCCVPCSYHCTAEIINLIYLQVISLVPYPNLLCRLPLWLQLAETWVAVMITSGQGGVSAMLLGGGNDHIWPGWRQCDAIENVHSTRAESSLSSSLGGGGRQTARPPNGKPCRQLLVLGRSRRSRRPVLLPQAYSMASRSACCTPPWIINPPPPPPPPPPH